VSVPLAFLDFLDSREKAVVLWALVLVVFVAVKGEGFVGSLIGVLRTLVAPKLLLIFGSAAVSCAAVVLLASEVGLWHTTAIKETVYWFFGTGVVLVGNAIQWQDDPDCRTKLLRQALRFTIIVEFLINLYVFPLAVEILLVPLVLLFVVMQVVAERDPSLAQARKPIDFVLTAFGLALLVHFAVSAISDLEGFLTRENAEDFLVAPALTLAFAPFLYVVVRLAKREMANLRKRQNQPPTPGLEQRTSTRPK
jgi:hypothetical protein